MSPRARVVALVLALQLCLVGVYLLVEGRRAAQPAGDAELGTAPPLAVSGLVPPLTLERRDGSQLDLRAANEPILLHVWASWCPPCRAELPLLFSMLERGQAVVAVALDADWSEVDRFLDGRSFPNLLRGDAAELAQALRVRSLPVTFLVEPGGRLRLRFDGARDWSDESFLRTWMGDAVGERPFAAGDTPARP